jgi:hypothetical protein
MTDHKPLLKAADDPELQIVYGEVYAPVDLPDTQGDVMSADVIRQTAHRFMKDLRGHQIDIEHDQQTYDAYVVESYIAQKGDEVFIPGSWVVGVHIPDVNIWNMVKSGELNGFSLEAIGRSVSVEIEIDIPESVTGLTLKSDNPQVPEHDHDFVAFFNKDGTFAGGRALRGKTDHEHELDGTVTKMGGSPSHSHRYSAVDFFASQPA